MGGPGERLPFRERAVGAVLLVVTLCFADGAVLVEARRVLRPGAPLVLGMVFADSAFQAWQR